MTTELRTLTEADVPQLVRLLAFAFGGEPDARTVAGVTRALPHTTGILEDGRLTSTARMNPFHAYVAGRRVRVGALASVATAAEARRRGQVRTLLADALRTLHEQGVGWCLEHPFDPTFYARFGFQSVPNGRELDLPVRRLFAGAPPEARPVEPDHEDLLAPLHAAFARRFHFALSRDDGWRTWERVWRTREERAPRSGFLLEDAYAVVGFERFDDPRGGQHLRLLAADVGWTTPAGRRRLFTFLGSLDGQVERVRIHLPPSDPLVADWAAWHTVDTTLLQARPADLAAALAPFTLPQPREAVVRVRDDFCPWNAGSWRIAAGPDGTTLEPAPSAPATLDVTALTRLVTGGASAEAVLADGGAEGEIGPLRLLADLAGGRTSFLSAIDYF